MYRFFVCENCQTIECISLVNYVDKLNNNYPNMSFLDMIGVTSNNYFMHPNLVFNDIDLNKFPAPYYIGAMDNVEFVKSSEQIYTLCSECNTGKWHGLFPKETVNGEDKILSLASKYNMLNLYDHDKNIVKIDKESKYGIKVSVKKDKPNKPRHRRKTMASATMLAALHMFNVRTLKRRKSNDVVLDPKNDFTAMIKSEIKKRIKNTENINTINILKKLQKTI